MATKQNVLVEKVYTAGSAKESEWAYDEWAKTYEADMFSYGSRFPFVAASIFTRFVKPDEGPILDAGCGTGLQIEPIWLAGYRDIVGIDLSDGMLVAARRKGMYRDLHKMTLGERLDFDDGAFANTITVGTITPGHAPPHSFEELIRVTRKSGRIIVNMRTDNDVDPAYPAALKKYERDSLWTRIFSSEEYAAMPFGEPEVRTTVFVYEIL